MGDDKVHIFFDEECRVRVLDQDIYKHTEDLENDSKHFIDKMNTFKETVGNIVRVLNEHGTAIENKKLQAIGMRQKVELESENRERQKIALQKLIKEEMLELDNMNLQYKSLLSVEANQRVLLEKLELTDSTLYMQK